MKYSDCIANWLKLHGYERCFFVGGGNIMHLIESISNHMECTPVIHEVAAGIAAEYYNETSNKGKAFALVTAGPGVTNIATAMAGAYLESRELLVIGGQVKTSDLSYGQVRQRGIQEIDGISILDPISKNSVLIDKPIGKSKFMELVLTSCEGRPGPVFLEIPLDVQGQQYLDDDNLDEELVGVQTSLHSENVEFYSKMFAQAERPVILIGGGVSRETVSQVYENLITKGIPVCTTWNAADRVGFSEVVYCGRPNTWGQRSANLIIQQADLLLAVGTRLGLQQTGFNWQHFLPSGKIIHVDIDQNELNKGHPNTEYKVCADANLFLRDILQQDLGEHCEWLAYAKNIRKQIPLVEDINITRPEYISPYAFIDQISELCSDSDIIIPCSSGGAFTTTMQAFEQKKGQKIVTNKGLASMGYGLSGAIGASLANISTKTILIEGDGGFAQNIQEIGTAKINNLNIKIFIFDDAGYASIRMTQKNYFSGKYVGCDTNTGLGLPSWEKLFKVWGVPTCIVSKDIFDDKNFLSLFNSHGLSAFIIKIDPEQTYYPKITSKVTDDGSMVSNPLHKMSPELSPDVIKQVSKYIDEE